MNLAGKKVFVLGGGGFVGTRLSEVLIEQHGCLVTVGVRNMSTAARVSRHPVKIRRVDAYNEEELAAALSGHDYLVDCTFVKRETGDLETWATKLASSIGNAALKAKIQRLVHLSTVAVYGDPQQNPITEQLPAKPSDDYASTKSITQNALLELFRERNLPVVVVMPTVVYGPFSNWSRQVLNEMKAGPIGIPMLGAGRCNGVYIDDLVQGIVLSMAKPGIEGECFLVSGKDEFTWKDYYQAHHSILEVEHPALLSESEMIDLQKQTKKQKSAFYRLLSFLRTNGELRHIVLALPLISHVYKGFNFFSGKKSHSKIKSKLLGAAQSQISNENSPIQPIPQLTKETQKRLYTSKATVIIEKSQNLLGYQPQYSLNSSMELIHQWAQWSREFNCKKSSDHSD